MISVLCYGDSNTWGYDPATLDRFPREVRWTGVLRRELGDGYLVIEEGLNGRTTVWDDPIEGYKNGKEYLIPCLETHRPVDLAIIMLGTNDLKMRFSVSAYDIANGAGVLVDIVQKSAAGPNGRAPQVLLIAPPRLATLTGYFADMFEGAPAKALRFAAEYGRVAQEKGCHFLDAGSIIVSSDLDGIHFEAAEHAKLGQAVAQAVRRIMG
ncbi:MAG TPA: SGNH/GDSL hydrolase family protein [Caldilineaceae bacterium]|nr:SGNH/GDSL hydrolase family protein [Caldilineaceae bacterium]